MYMYMCVEQAVLRQEVSLATEETDEWGCGWGET